MPPTRDRRRGARLGLGLGLRECALGACVLAAAIEGVCHRWSCDDAFISFRYAENFARGAGLVFNAGERVEGYTNFLWTLALAPAFTFGVSPEVWSQLLGGAVFVGTVALLWALHGAFAKHARVAPLVLPFACAAAALHREWAIFAMSGLETAAFTLTVTGAFATIVWPTSARSPCWQRRGALAGGLFGVGVLLRPDGVVFAAAAGAWLAAMTARSWRVDRAAAHPRALGLVAFALTCGAIVLAQLAFRLGYYGDWLPNTYYAKSANVAWYGQGLRYAWLYALRYPVVALFPFALGWLATRPADSAVRRAMLAPASLAAVMAVAHIAWVVRVGGDFMFARFLVPATPLGLFVLEAALLAAAVEGRRRLATVASAVAIATFALLPSPIADGKLESGIADEYAFYSPERVEVIDERAARIRPILAGTGARVAFYSAQARLVYRADIPIAIESETGLTDAFVARQAIAARHRVGHEKKAPPDYLIDVRHTHLAAVAHNPTFDAAIPFVPAELNGVRMQLLTWDDAFVQTIRKRGAIVADYPAMLDDVLRELDTMSDDRAAGEYARARRFYFAVTKDETRERPFLERLARR